MSSINNDQPENDGSVDFDLGDSDYGFILSNDGQIKALIMPSTGGPAPAVVRKIFKLLDIGDPESFNVTTLH